MPRTVTVVSPPEMSAAGALAGWPWRRIWRAIPAWTRADVARLALQAVAENDGAIAFGGGDPGGGLRESWGER